MAEMKIEPGRTRRGRLSAFIRDKKGVTAVEFALIAAPFLALLVAIIQTFLVFFAQELLESAVMQASRQIMTGQVQNSNTTQSQFANIVCPMIQAMFTCSKLMINVQNYSTFSAASTGAPTLTYNAQGQVTNTWVYSPGSPGDVMVVQLIYQWPIVRGPFGYVLSNLGNGTTEMMGVSAFRIEPY